MTSPQNKITIYGPKDDGTYIVEFRTAVGAGWSGRCWTSTMRRS